jgi:hypothetical protein
LILAFSFRWVKAIKRQTILKIALHQQQITQPRSHFQKP